MSAHVAIGAGQLQRVADLVRTLNPQKAWRVEISQHHKKRTISQNKLLWAIYQEVASETGHTEDEIHDYCKIKFLPKRIVNIEGKDDEIPGSTAILDKPAFSEYVERVSAWAATELGIAV